MLCHDWPTILLTSLQFISSCGRIAEKSLVGVDRQLSRGSLLLANVALFSTSDLGYRRDDQRRTAAAVLWSSSAVAAGCAWPYKQPGACVPRFEGVSI